MGNDYYAPEIGIGPNCDIKGAILDKNVRLGEGVVIRPFRAAQSSMMLTGSSATASS